MQLVIAGPWWSCWPVVILGAAAAVYFLGYLPRERTTKQLDAAAAVRRVTPPLVNAAVVKRAAPSTQLMLPGNITPITEAYIYARAAGYLKRRYVDIGDRVQAGQKLADIEAPDLDQQVSQARAALAQAQGQLGQAQATLEQLIATRDLAEITWQRYKVLTADGAVSRQDGDNQSTAAKTSAANVVAQQKTVRATEEYVRASQATLDRLLALQGYERITAPFAGVITARNVDVGALISATGSSLGPSAIQYRGAVRRSQRRRNISSGGNREASNTDCGSANQCARRPRGPGRDGHRPTNSQSEFSRQGDAHIQTLWTLNPGRC